nr:ATP-grasp domain-containing protein [Syntrophomonas palmitatica]
MTRVLVLLGGTSEEREVSLKSGEGVYQALLRKGFEAEKLDLAENKLSEIERISPDVVFIALHGKNGEDGTVQGYLELLGIPYTGSGVACSAICMNKIISKKMFIYEGLPTPDFVILSKKAFTRDGLVLKSLIEKFGLPLVVKPATQGSSIGTHIVKLESGLQEAVEDAFRLDNEILVEKFIDGDLLTVAVIGNDELRYCR